MLMQNYNKQENDEIIQQSNMQYKTQLFTKINRMDTNNQTSVWI